VAAPTKRVAFHAKTRFFLLLGRSPALRTPGYACHCQVLPAPACPAPPNSPGKRISSGKRISRRETAPAEGTPSRRGDRQARGRRFRTDLWRVGARLRGSMGWREVRVRGIAGQAVSRTHSAGSTVPGVLVGFPAPAGERPVLADALPGRGHGARRPWNGRCEERRGPRSGLVSQRSPARRSVPSGGRGGERAVQERGLRVRRVVTHPRAPVRALLLPTPASPVCRFVSPFSVAESSRRTTTRVVSNMGRASPGPFRVLGGLQEGVEALPGIDLGGGGDPVGILQLGAHFTGPKAGRRPGGGG